MICGVDHSPLAYSVVEAAAALANGLQARLVLAHSPHPPSVPLTRGTLHPGFPGRAPADPSADDAAYDLLDGLLPHADTVPVETLLLDDEPAAALCGLARALSADLVVVGSRGTGAVGTILFGSIPADLMRGAPCPVVVIPHAALGDVERPLVDGSAIICGIGTPEDRRLARVAGSLASGLGLRLRVAHVMRPLSDLVAERGGVVPARRDIVAPLRAPDVPAVLRDILEDILCEHPDLDGRADWCLRSGDPGAELAELAVASHAAAIVVGMCRRGLLRAAISRSPAAKLARTATVPVVISRDTLA